MAKSRDRSMLYRLIEAGQLAHQALLAPLIERGLEPGDDALLFLLADYRGATEAEIAAGTSLDPEQLHVRLERLIERDLATRRAVGSQLVPGLVLTDRGDRIRKHLAEHWDQLEVALAGELKKSHRKTLHRRLARVATILRS